MLCDTITKVKAMKERVTSGKYQERDALTGIRLRWKHPIQTFGEDHSGAVGRKLSIPHREPALKGN